MSGFITIKKRIKKAGKYYTICDSFVSKDTAERLRAKYKKQGLNVRVIQQGGIMHAINRYHVYVRK